MMQLMLTETKVHRVVDIKCFKLLMFAADLGSKHEKKEVRLYPTNKYPGAVFILRVPGNRLVHSEVGLALIQLIDQLHLCKRTENKRQGFMIIYQLFLCRYHQALTGSGKVHWPLFGNYEHTISFYLCEAVINPRWGTHGQITQRASVLCLILNVLHVNITSN